MTKKRSPGDAVFVVKPVAVVYFGVAALLVVFFFGDAADAEPATNTASIAPSENITSVIATTATALRRGVGLLTTHLPCRSPVAPGSRSLPGGGRGGLRSHCDPHAPPGPRSSAEGR